uniref:Uncharacterized protein n=1 Tax=Timema douglasi TaxID=61478 RepID=A0A7R8ZGQ1_TIMDO|nr:unnamed protein product [Timema douglasi]
MNLSTSKSVGNILGLHRQTSQQFQQHSLRKSQSTSNCVIISKRGFKPSDRFDPHKREFLTTLSSRLLHISLVPPPETLDDDDEISIGDATSLFLGFGSKLDELLLEDGIVTIRIGDSEVPHNFVKTLSSLDMDIVINDWLREGLLEENEKMTDSFAAFLMPKKQPLPERTSNQTLRLGHPIGTPARYNDFPLRKRLTTLGYNSTTILWEHQTERTQVIRLGADSTTVRHAAFKGHRLTFASTDMCNLHMFVMNKIRKTWIDKFWIPSELNPVDHPSRGQTIQMIPWLYLSEPSAQSPPATGYKREERGGFGVRDSVIGGEAQQAPFNEQRGDRR